MQTERASSVRKGWRDLDVLAPGMVKAISAIGAVAKGSELDKELIKLIKIRASQLNGCAYCLQLHINIAREAGMAPERIDLLPVWAEVDVYTDREKAALAWTEAVNDIAHGGVSDEAYAAIHSQFSEEEVAILSAVIVQINAYNRLGAIYRMKPPVPSRGVDV
jgi:AhpD family alkylhydroperoxidase